MITTIPMTNDPNYTQVSRLGDIEYFMTFRWNNSEEAWYLSILNEDGSSSCKVKLVQGIDLLSCFSSTTGFPKGELWLVGGLDERMTLDDAKSDGGFSLVFIPKEDGSFIDFFIENS